MLREQKFEQIMNKKIKKILVECKNMLFNIFLE